MNAIVLLFDRMPLSFLGLYGNSWIATPNLDRLASQSTVFEQHFAEGLDWNSAACAPWSARFLSQSSSGSGTPVLNILRDSGVHIRVVEESGVATFEIDSPGIQIETVA